YGTEKTADQRRDAIFEDSQILRKAARPCPRHRRHLRCHRRFRDPPAADRVGGGSRDGAATFHGAGPAMAVVAGTGSGGNSRLGSASILAVGGWGDCCPGHSSAEIRTALTNRTSADSYSTRPAARRRSDRIEAPMSAPGTKRTCRGQRANVRFRG